jgi:hypothetical protein
MAFCRLIPFAFALAFFGAAGISAAPSKDESLQLRQTRDEFILTVPASKLDLHIPRKGLKKLNGASSNPRYFYFEDAPKGMIVSGWFESQANFSSAKEVWEGDTKQWSLQGLPAPANVSFQKIDRWDAVLYDMLVAPGTSLPVRNPHIRAHWVQAGTWIDLHLSMVSNDPKVDSRAQVMALLKSIQVTEKK